MTTDRELLEAAAKAAGIEIEWSTQISYPHIVGMSGNSQRCFFNPLTDDGDEARLETKLEMDVKWFIDSVVVGKGREKHREFFAEHGGEKQKARKYAGVRAAAEIGIQR